MADYKIDLGIILNPSDLAKVKTTINNLENSKKINLEINKKKIDSQVDSIRKQIQNLSNIKINLGNGDNSLQLNTEKLDSSLKEVATSIKAIKTSLGTLDGSGDMKSLVTSVNQIGAALDKASGKFDELNAQLSALSKKDFSINFGFNMGKNASQVSSEQGDLKRSAISQLKQQAKALEDYLDQYYKVAQKQEGVVKLTQGTNLFSSFWEMSPNIGNTKVSLKQQVATYKQYIDLMQEAAKIKGVDLSSVTSGFSKTTNDIVEGTKNVADGAEEVKQTLKGIFGGSLDIEGLSGQLQPIITDLGEIKTAIQSLSSNNSIDGLTQSFNRLSETLEKLTANLTLAKNTLDTGFSNTAPANNVVKVAQQTGQKIGKAVTESANQSMNIDDVIDKQVTDLMEKYAIAGEKGSDSFNKIKQALLECRNELEIIKNGNFDIDEQAFGNSAAIDKVTNALSEQMKVANETAEIHGKLADYIKKYNTGGYKVHLPDSVKQEYGDDYVRMARTLGSAFTTGKGQDFESFIEDLNNELGETISLSNGAEAAFKQLHDEVVYDREQAKVQNKKKETLLSEDELFDRNYLNREEVYDDTISAINAISEAEQKIAQSSTQAANIVSQNEERKQQAYRETANAYDAISKETSLVGNDGSFQKTFEVSNQAAQEAQRHFQELLADEKAVVSVTEQFDSGNALQSFAVNVKRASGEVETLRYAMDKLNDEGAEGFVYQSGSTSDRNVEKQLQARIKASNNLQIKLEKIKADYSDMGATKPIKNSDYIASLDEQYKKVEKAIIDVKNADNSTFASMLSNAEREKAALESMVKVYRNADNVSNSLKGTDFASGVKIRIEELGKFKAQASDFPQMAKTIKELDRAIEGVGDKSSLDSFTDQLKVARAELAKVKAETIAANRKEMVGIDVSGATSRIADIQRISPEIDNFKAKINGAEVTVESLLNDLSKVNTAGDFSVVNKRLRAFEEAAKSAGIAVTEAVTKVNSVNKIKNKLSDTGFNGFEQEVRRAHTEAEKLESSTSELEAALKRLDTAMEAVYSADQSSDIKRLVAANEEYENALKQVYSQLKLNQQAEQDVFKAEMLSQKKASLSSEMEIWLKENTRAAKDFGEEIRRLQASLDGLDANGVKLVGQQFNAIKKQAKALGKDGLTVFDKLKAKAKEYMTYLSAAEMFMYTEQALRAMFDTVKEIDTAMTGLYRVTDLTSAEYDALFNNMISSAKEYGATLNDIINATTDWVRAGFDANTSLGLAEVTTMYQHISDLDYDTAAENLITAYNGFKDELNGAFSGDQVAAVEYIADIFNELDR